MNQSHSSVTCQKSYDEAVGPLLEARQFWLGGDSTEDCRKCVKSQGLCSRHAQQIARLAQPHWYRLVGTNHQDEAPIKASPEALAIIKRKDRKRAKRLRQLVDLIAHPVQV